MKTIRCYKYIILSIAWLLFISLPVTSVIAQDPPAGQETDATEAPAVNVSMLADEDYNYVMEGRADPFLPFISERTTSNEQPDTIIEEDKILTGMQLFEPSQLTLVALLESETDRFAMVQDFTGKGYVIEIGTKIGRDGEVTDIVDNKVIITETTIVRGTPKDNKIVMVLNQEGEE
ncbi:MAG: hypothetical protein D6B25_12880 [Desulfobulbaceae bacterium]|nr:MAG: hypothetical protein D6B25_12880 [Desulfobulbaceae bacterium]